jgi:hypothetical protein
MMKEKPMRNYGPLYIVPDGVETRWASAENPKGQKGRGGRENAGRKGRPCLSLKAGEEAVLADVRGSGGTVRRIWITINDRSPRMLRGLRLDCWWDGAARQAVSAPLGDFFGTGLGRMARFECAPFSSPEGRSFNCVLPMPFRTGMKIAVTNETDADLGALFYDVDYTLGDAHPEDALYLHAHWRRENPTAMQQDYEILPAVEGRGRFLGSNIGVIADRTLYLNSWWGEGEVKVYLDGDAELPTLCGTGTEDYIGTGWGQGRYANLYQGCHVADHHNMQYCFYRYHIPDPIYFRRDCRATIQQIGYWDREHKVRWHYDGRTIYTAGPGLKEIDLGPQNQQGGGIFERQDDWSSCAYFYLSAPANDLPELPPVEQRTAGLMEKPPIAE